MGLKCDPENLYDEVKAAEQYRDRFLDKSDSLVMNFHGRYFDKERRPSTAITENFAFEFVALMLPSLMYGSPQFKVLSRTPNVLDDATQAQVDQLMMAYGARSKSDLAQMLGFNRFSDLVKAMGGLSMGLFAKGMEISLNRWAIVNEICNPLSLLAVDYFFNYGVAMTTTTDQPGHQNYEMTPQQPKIMRLSQYEFAMDPTAKTPRVLELNGPRHMEHIWKADYDDLLEDPLYNREEVEKLLLDKDLEKYDRVRKSGIDIPKRREILAWSIWVPEKGFSDVEMSLDHGINDTRGYNGVVYTLAVSATPDGTSKKARWIRDPYPAYVPPWGPYTLFGYLPVPNCAYPLSLLAATAEKAVALNAHSTAIAEDAAKFKKVAVYDQHNPAVGEALRDAQHGDFVGVPGNAAEIKEVTIGGPAKEQTDELIRIADGLRRLAGVSESSSGNPSDRTATAESIADAGLRTRTSGMQEFFRRPTRTTAMAAAWYMFHGPDMRFDLDEEGERYGVETFTGGTEGRTKFNFYDLALSIDPHSHEHVDRARVQEVLTNAIQLLATHAPVMAQSPWIKWKEPIRELFDVMNVGHTDDWFDDDALSTAQGQVQLEQQQQAVSQDVQTQNSVADAERADMEAMARMQSEASREAGAIRE